MTPTTQTATQTTAQTTARATAPALANVRRLYQAFAALDGQAMQACYAPDAQFDDEAFSLRSAREVGGMWRMLCDTTRSKGMDAWRLEVGEVVDHGSHLAVRWEAHYRFTATGRLVHNTVQSRLECRGDGLVARQVDQFDFWRWSRQALGAPGLLLGWTPWLRAKVRAQAAANLQRFLAH